MNLHCRHKCFHYFLFLLTSQNLMANDQKSMKTLDFNYLIFYTISYDPIMLVDKITIRLHAINEKIPKIIAYK